MNYVNVNGEVLEFILRNCPLLEDLSVSQSRELTTLKIIGPFPSFKRLEISLCHNLNSVEIRDADLVYLKYEGSRIHFLLENVPPLVEIFVGGMITRHINDVRLMFLSYLPQLQKFKECEIFYSAVKMSNLKELEVKVLVPYDDYLISASPCLQRFVLKVLRGEPKFVKRKLKNIVSSYAHLKEVKFEHYCGAISDPELVSHFLKNAAALEKIIVDSYQLSETPYDYKWKYDGDFKDEIVKDEMDARTRAKKQLVKKVPTRINLEIL